jgi:aspartate/methionine/tyrosine aminotransferase
MFISLPAPFYTAHKPFYDQQLCKWWLTQLSVCVFSGTHFDLTGYHQAKCILHKT